MEVNLDKKEEDAPLWMLVLVGLVILLIIIFFVYTSQVGSSGFTPVPPR